MARTVRVLVVDDEPAVREAVTDMLRTLGMQAASAVSGRAALKLCAANCPFDVILSDVVMGDIGGVQLAETLREAYPSVPRIHESSKCGIPGGLLHPRSECRARRGGGWVT